MHDLVLDFFIWNELALIWQNYFIKIFISYFLLNERKALPFNFCSLSHNNKFLKLFVYEVIVLNLLGEGKVFAYDSTQDVTQSNTNITHGLDCKEELVKWVMQNHMFIDWYINIIRAWNTWITKAECNKNRCKYAYILKMEFEQR